MAHWNESEVKFPKPQAKTLQSEASWLKARKISLMTEEANWVDYTILELDLSIIWPKVK